MSPKCWDKCGVYKSQQAKIDELIEGNRNYERLLTEARERTWYKEWSDAEAELVTLRAKYPPHMIEPWDNRSKKCDRLECETCYPEGDPLTRVSHYCSYCGGLKSSWPNK